MSPRMPTPVEMGSVVEKTLRITWSDGHRSEYAWKHLRLNCPCAVCVGEWRYRPPRLTQADIRPDIRAMSVTKVGNYALRFVWSDGHETGIYTFALLQNELCECEACAGVRAPNGSTRRPDRA